jgi:hypothetical protein
MTATTTTYGPGGFDSSNPNGNVVSVEEVDLPDEPPSIEDRLADVERAVTGDTDAEARVRTRVEAEADEPEEPTRTR